MKRLRRLFVVLLTMTLFLSMGTTVFASDGSNQDDDMSIYVVETECDSSIMPRYTANLNFSAIPVSNATHGNNRFNMNPGGTITCNFSSTGKFSLAVYNYGTGTYWISDTVHSSSCNSVLTINTAGDYGIGVYNRDTKTITVTGSYTL